MKTNPSRKKVQMSQVNIFYLKGSWGKNNIKMSVIALSSSVRNPASQAVMTETENELNT